MKVLLITGTESHFDDDEFYVKLRLALNRFMAARDRVPHSGVTRSLVGSIPSKGTKVHGSQWTSTPTLNGFVLGGALRANGIPYDLITAVFVDRLEGEKEIEDALKKETYSVIGVSTSFFSTYGALRHLVEKIKRIQPYSRVIVGGQFLIGNRAVLDIPGIDYFVFGDGEEAFPALVKSLDNGIREPMIDGVVYRANGRFCGSTDYRTSDMNKQPLPAWETYLNSIDSSRRHYLSKETLFPLLVETTRGCPFRCAFCNYWTHYKIPRYKSAEAILREVRELYRLGVKKIGFWDSAFTFPRSRLLSLVEMLESVRLAGVEFTGFARFDDLDVELLRRMAAVGFRLLYFGIESGNAGILARMTKGTSTKDVTTFFEDFNKASIPIDFLASFIVGFPGETTETVNDTIRMMREIRVKYFNIQQLWIKEGSDIYSNPEKYGLHYEMKGNTRYAFRWEHETMTSDEAINEALRVFSEIHFSTNSLFAEPLFCITELSQRYSPLASQRNYEFLRLIQEGIALSLMNQPDCDAKQEAIWRKICRDFSDY